MQNALNTKAPINAPSFTGSMIVNGPAEFKSSVTGITKETIGLANVDNTSDINKPISVNMQNALDTKAPINAPSFTGSMIINGLADFKTIPIISVTTQPSEDNQIVTLKFVNDKITNILNIDAAILSSLQNMLSEFHQQGNLVQILDSKAPKDSPSFTGSMIVNGPVEFKSSITGITKETIGLANVDNTSDINKPISINMQNALDTKAPKDSPSFSGNMVVNGPVEFKSSVTGITKETIGLLNVDNTSDINKPISVNMQNALDTKAPINAPSFSGNMVVNGPVEFKSSVTGITKETIGLLNVDNTSDINKPISVDMQNALDTKAPLNAPSFSGNMVVNGPVEFKSSVTGITKETIGLSNVDNTSDINKPISVDMQNALDTKAPKDSPSFSGNMVVNGPVEFKSSITGITKETIGLANVDNTSDINKPISVDMQNALDTKAPKDSPSFTGNMVVNGPVEFKSSITGITKETIGLANVDNTSDINKPISVDMQNALDTKAPINAPSFSGDMIINDLANFKTIPIVTDLEQPSLDNQIATVKFVNDKISPSLLLQLQNLLNEINNQSNLAQILDSKAPKDSPSFTGSMIVNGPVEFKSSVTGITKETIGLSNVDNTSDINKPISVDMQNALDTKAPLISPTFSENVSINGSLNVQSTTSFSLIPIVSSQIIPSQDNQLVTLKYVNDRINFKITDQIINNNELLTNLSKILQTKISSLLTTQATFNSITINNSILSNANLMGAILTNPILNGNIIGFDKKKIGLGNVDNTSDLNKPVSNATELELNKKANINAPIFTGIVKIMDNKDTISTVTGALTVKGGVGICGGINIGKKLTVSGESKLNNVFVENINVNGNITFGNMLFNLNTIIAIDNLIKMPNLSNLINIDINNSLQELLDNKAQKSYVDDAISQLNFSITNKIEEKANTITPEFQKNISVNGSIISQGLNICPVINDTYRTIEPVDQNYKIDNLVPVSYLNKNNGKREIRIETNSFTTDLPFLVNTQSQVNAGVGQNIGQTVDYISIIGLLVKEIQDLKQTVSELKLKLE
jgi:hypothetical protein